MNNIKQFKLSNGEEIICEVVQWPSEEESDIVVRNSFKIITAGSRHEGITMYQLKPWMVYQDESDLFQLINGNHVVGEANPPLSLIVQYKKIVNGDQAEIENIEESIKKIFEDVLETAEEGSEEKEEENNIINLFQNTDKDKMH